MFLWHTIQTDFNEILKQIVCVKTGRLSLKELQKVKKWSRYRHSVAQRVGTDIALLFHDLDTRKGWVVNRATQLRFTHGKDPVSLYRRLGGSQGRSGRAENLVPTGIRPRTVQAVVSHYTAWATWPILKKIKNGNSASIKGNTCTYSIIQFWCINAMSFTKTSLSAGTFNQ